jgi:DNA mismatch endonuclease, patch repair protein
MADMFTAQQRSIIMGRIRSRGNHATELQFVRLLRKNRIRGWRRGSGLPGKPDFVFATERVAVFVDGDFWHGNPKKFRLPRSNTTYWTAKILGNRRRDRAVNRMLRLAGWRVIRFWQSSLVHEGRVVRRLTLGLEVARTKSAQRPRQRRGGRATSKARPDR